ncbi:aminotransferase class I/II-fold pyridoxal phosphate-dependent enzyme [Synechococcus elongatus]|uniref:Arginine decarboxylase n=1 Tax=Synechococcus elongatus (strain ATCC 33912 / PCC 7942 / FACHB-805) TaxID=1140 RepID=Q31QD0_SYNE7|nr:aminotransferase class I/II-fold pyridoxal phosphate-dependent enzyme [Synechococcus elongatus]ABB56739.1 arginine decarboxylase [Synechococcus elongatus PCC 7942 = FACHB-805]AJD58720.1 lysine decarboxylase [Synechococcus elongatus UTEX 2973]MBD2588599.1 aminotransferase class I/II-fold pyridoxal phosphate-dependent enzyme [Synechococcus elongatus FACHB-242]MBD2689812.1 aminotransferase class I/II-fold pyridoxal phosphate-dependent enzyme [Synechococcus elongatus FACHB-1061]MBD2708419.1 ami
MAKPLFDQLLASAQQARAPFHTPGHKLGRAIATHLQQAWGSAIFQSDLPELPELDNLYAASGVLAESQAQAAEVFGADRSWFLVNGSTGGLLAAILTICSPGDRLLLPRNAHRSLLSGCILSGAMPVWITPPEAADFDLVGVPTPEQVATALAQDPQIKAVVLVSPTYEGVCADVAAIAAIAHNHNLPLIIDAAHGAHLGFHPDLPRSPLHEGADLVVQSTHKLLGALTQAAMLHCKGDRIDPERLSQSLALVQSSSPSYLLLASLEAATEQMRTSAQDLLQVTIDLARQAHQRLAELPGLQLPALKIGNREGFPQWDRTRLVINFQSCGWSGFCADEYLHEQWQVTAELPSLSNLVFHLSLGNRIEDIDRLVTACDRLLSQEHQEELPPRLPVWLEPETILSPRQAWFSRHQTVSAEQAIGAIAAECVCPYPPGIPVLLPGERISKSAVDYLRQVQTTGGILSGCADPELTTLRIVQDSDTIHASCLS